MRKSAEYFPDNEVACKGTKCGCGGIINFDSLFDEAIWKVRKKLNLPMIPTSANRCKKHNDLPQEQGGAGGASKSFHIADLPQWGNVKGCAAMDVRYTNITYRNALARVSYEAGLRIGLNKKFLHLDGAHLAGYTNLPRFFKYGNITPKELQEFTRQITNNKD